MAKYASLIVWVDWEDHSTLLYRSWFDHLAGCRLPKFQVFHLPAQFLDPCKFNSSTSFSSPHLTQSNSFREPKRFASFYRCCRYYALLQREQSMGKKQQESDLYYSSLSESTVVLAFLLRLALRGFTACSSSCKWKREGHTNLLVSLISSF